MTFLKDFNSIWVTDFEYTSAPGERPDPVCMVAQDLKSGKTETHWLAGENGGDLTSSPYSVGKDSLFVSYYEPAEMSCHLRLGWPMPLNSVDLFAEHRTLTNGIPGVGNSLLAACKYWGVESIPDSEHKEKMRNLILSGGPYSDNDQKSILEYCAEDVRLTSDLFQKMQLSIDWPRALFRGMYMESIARMEHRGIPIDMVTLTQLQQHWPTLKLRLVEEINADYGVYEGLTFKVTKFERYIADKSIPWPRTGTGRLSLSDDVFKDMTKVYPFLQGLRDIRYLLGVMKLGLTKPKDERSKALSVGSDGRNRTMLSPFSSKTGRNQPSSAAYIFGPAVWLRSLIQPEPGRALIYADYSQQEFAIAGYLSGDLAMQAAYESGDPYMDFAIRAGAAEPGSTKESHPYVRALYKEAVLATQYGMGPQSLAMRISKPPIYAEELLRQHRRVFHTYWSWSDGVLNNAILTRDLVTPLGWRYKIAGDGLCTLEDGKIKESAMAPRTIRNWLMQSTGSDILRMACVLLDREGLELVGPVHDALLLECLVHDADNTANRIKETMERASAIVLGNGKVRVEHSIIRYPDRYTDPRGSDTWNRVTRLLDGIEGSTS